MEWWLYLVLLGAGAASGFINSMAGGGSLLTLPALMLAGLPADVANGTNRIGILVQSITGFADYRRSGVKGFGLNYLLLVPLCAGSLLGALAVGFVPNEALGYVIIAVILLASCCLFVQPAKWAKPLGQVSDRLARTPAVWAVMVAIGFYAGFIQVASGFLVLIVLVLWGSFDVLHANAFKLLTQLTFTLLVFPIFIANGKVAWMPGLFLSLGSIMGSWIGARLAVKKGSKLVRWLLVASIAVFAAREIYNRLG